MSATPVPLLPAQFIAASLDYAALLPLLLVFGFALVGAVVGEYLGAIKGVGLMIVVAQNTFNANGVFAAIVILATVALVAEALVTAIENRLVKWRPNQVTEVTI